MKHLAAAFFFLTTLTTPAISLPHHEFTLSPSSLSFNRGTIIDLDFGYAFTVHPNIQISVASSFSYLESVTGTGTTVFALLAGPTLNIPIHHEALYDSVFLTVAGGLAYGASGLVLSATNGAFSVVAGVRIKLFEHLAYKPAFAMTKILNGSNFLFSFVPASFSVLF